MTTATLLLLGIGLAAATGFRVFVPPLMLAIGHQIGLVDLPPDAVWLASPTAIVLLSAATLAEVGAYYVPLVDNLLDTIATPAALVAGTLLAGVMLPELEPWLRWTAAAVVGGGTAGSVQALTSLTRAASTGATAGLGNPVVATGELVGATLLSLLALLAPVLAGAAALVLIVVGVRALLRWRRST
ncbi:MAG: DUF4126 domain-containing protein [Trueperaceae bacterium]